MPKAGAGSVRVVAGQYRGLRLETLPGIQVRPTADRVKEALFSILGPVLDRATVVDCFAGTGALGIEALSRGATRVFFVENGRTTVSLLRRNLERLPEPAKATILVEDALAPEIWGRNLSEADVILADPPYGKGIASRFLDSMARVSVLKSEGVLVLEHEKTLELEHRDWERMQRRPYGDTTVSMFRRFSRRGE